jgi:hypothetical protein
LPAAGAGDFTGHFIVLIGFRRASDDFLYLDPAADDHTGESSSGANLTRRDFIYIRHVVGIAKVINAKAFHAAWSHPGTDADLIICRR